MSLLPPDTVGKLQAALHTKAKGSPAIGSTRCTTSCTARTSRPTPTNAAVPMTALVCRRADLCDIEAYGLNQWLEELTQALHRKTYQPQAVRRVWIPRQTASNGRWASRRPGPCRTDGCGVVLEPIFEADLQDEQFAYRPGRSALAALEAVRGLLCGGHTEVVDADLSGYFDSIPHAELMRCVRRRISDRHLLGCWHAGWRCRSRRRTNAGGVGGRPAPKTRPAAPRKGRRCPRYSPICTCVVSSGMEDAGTRATPRRLHRQLCR